MMELLGFTEILKFMLYVAILLLTDLKITSSAKIPMRIVRDTASYGYFGNNIGDAEIRDHLVAKVKPSNISGPVQLHRLLGVCYNVTLDRYRYSFCPFQNMTQYEISNRWNAYQGVIGIWDQWNIENNKFNSMQFRNGDPCGNTDRSAQVFLQCGTKNELVNVTEPKKCQYSAVFITKLVCHKDALLVYPRLSPDLQKKWDFLYTEFQNGYLSEKGYKARLQELFQEAQLTRNQDIKEKPDKDTTENTTVASNHQFLDLMTCNKEYKNLKEEVAELRQEVESLKLLFDVSKVQGTENKTPPKN